MSIVRIGKTHKRDFVLLVVGLSYHLDASGFHNVAVVVGGTGTTAASTQLITGVGSHTGQISSSTCGGNALPKKQRGQKESRERGEQGCQATVVAVGGSTDAADEFAVGGR